MYFCDDFAGNNTNKWDLLPTGTGNSLTPNGTFDVVDDSGNYELRYTAASTGGVIALVKPSAFTGVPSADYYVEAKIRPRVNSTTSNKQIYLIARYQDGNNWYAGALNVQSTTATTQIEIAKMKAGSISRPKQVKKPLTMGTLGALDGQWYTLRIELIGTTLTVYLDGENLGSVTDADFTTQGSIGLWTANKSFEIDDIKVGDASQKPASLLLSPSTATYAAEVGDAARVIAVTAKTDLGVDDTFTVASDNTSVVGVVTNGTNVSLTPLSAGTANITFTSVSKPDLKRTITATIAPAFVMPTATYNLTGLVTPAVAAASTYEDQILQLTFDSAPTLGSAGSVRIFKVSDDTLVDTIKLTAESDAIGFGTLRTINTRPIRITGNTASISLHSNKLALGTAYYVAISGSVFTGATLSGQAFTGIGKNTGWAFTTRAATPSAGLTSLTVDDTGTTADFRTVQSALNYVMQNVALDTAATITVKNGTYEEPLYLRNKNNLTLVGESRTGTLIQYPNNDGLNAGSNGRAVWLVDTSDLLTIDNLTLKNTTIRSNGGQAETIYFNSPTGRLVATNANFISEQDTLLLKGYTWFYNTLVAGNVDFIWGYSKVSLFEKSEIRTLSDSANATSGGYVLQARVESATDKGFVFLNSSLTRGPGPVNSTVPDGATYLARSGGCAGCYDNIVFVNTKMDAHVAPVGWFNNPAPTPSAASATGGWREYASMDINGTTLSTASRLAASYQMSLGDVATEYCSRAQIFKAYNSNAGWNPMPSDTTDCINVDMTSSSSASSAPAVPSSSSSSSSAVVVSSSSSSSSSAVAVSSSSSSVAPSSSSSSSVVVVSSSSSSVAPSSSSSSSAVVSSSSSSEVSSSSSSSISSSSSSSSSSVAPVAVWSGAALDLFGTSTSVPLGSVTTNTSTALTLTAKGGSLNTSNRKFYFASQDVTGDFVFTARLSSVSLASGSAFTVTNNNQFRFGILATESVTPVASYPALGRFAELGFFTLSATPTYQGSRAYKLDMGAATTQSRSNGTWAVGDYLRITKVGNAFTLSTSADGVTYTAQNTSSFIDANSNPYATTMKVGFFAASGADELTLAFTNISITQ